MGLVLEVVVVVISGLGLEAETEGAEVKRAPGKRLDGMAKVSY